MYAQKLQGGFRIPTLVAAAVKTPSCGSVKVDGGIANRATEKTSNGVAKKRHWNKQILHLQS